MQPHLSAMEQPSGTLGSLYNDEDAGAFGTATAMAYSSFSHIGEVQNLSFAVGLREDEEMAALYVKKILPMSFYEPGKPLEERVRKLPEVKDVDLEAIDVPEIAEMRQRLREIMRGCDKMEREEQRMETDLKAAMDRLGAWPRGNLISAVSALILL